MSTATITATITATETDRVIAAMFTENTGIALCDSGGISGRGWQRQAGKTVEDFLAEPEAYWGFGNEYVNLSTFHFMRRNLSWDAELQAEFDAYAESDEMAEEGWLTIMEGFAELHAGAGNYGTVNTYNHDSALDTVLQFTQADPDSHGEWVSPGDDGFIIVQVHGGADVRGGYTAPKIFRADGGYDGYGLLDDNVFEVSCSGSVESSGQTEALPGFPDTPPREVFHHYSYRGGVEAMGQTVTGEGWTDIDESTLSDDIFQYNGPKDDQDRPLCPNCHDGASFLTPYVMDC